MPVYDTGFVLLHIHHLVQGVHRIVQDSEPIRLLESSRALAECVFNLITNWITQILYFDWLSDHGTLYVYDQAIHASDHTMGYSRKNPHPHDGRHGFLTPAIHLDFQNCLSPPPLRISKFKDPLPPPNPPIWISIKSARGPHGRDVTHILRKVSCFFIWNPFIFIGYKNNRFFSHTNTYILNVTQQSQCSPMLIFWAWATCDFSWYLQVIARYFRKSNEGKPMDGNLKYIW